MATAGRRVLEVAGTGVGVGGLVGLGLVSGVDLWVVTIDLLRWPVRADFFEGSLTVALFTLFLLVAGGHVVRDVWTASPATGARVSDGPPLLAIVPAYREAGVLATTVERLLESDYERLRVAVVVEPGDGPTRRAAAALAARHAAVRVLENDAPGSKATAINTAVRDSDAAHFAVFDADEWVTPGFLAGAMAALDAGADVVQGRRVPRPTGAVETLAYCERVLVQAGYACGELVGFVHCQSSSTVFTRAAFAATGGYSDTLTEDIDFSHKCHRAGLTVVTDRGLANTMEAPHTVRDLWGQRTRWRIGHVQVVDRWLRATLTGGIGPGAVGSVGRATGGLLAGAFLVVLAAHVAVLVALGVESAFLVPAAVLLAVIGGVWSRDYAAGIVGPPHWSIGLAPLVVLGHGLLTVKALLAYSLTWDGEWYRVTKAGG